MASSCTWFRTWNDRMLTLLAFIMAFGMWVPLYLNSHVLSHSFESFIDRSVKILNISQSQPLDMNQTMSTHNRTMVHPVPVIHKSNDSCHNFSFEFGMIYNCSTPSIIGDIGIVSMHRKALATKSSWKLDTQWIINNHLSYVRSNGYIYFEITDYSQHLFSAHKSFHHREILLMKPYLIHKILTSNPNLRYLIWLDLDTLFFNCTKMEQAIIKKAYSLYQYHADIIFSYEPNTVANSGVVAWSNTQWTKMFLQRMIAMCEKFQRVIDEVHIGWGDQNIFIATLMGYDDTKHNYSNETDEYLKLLQSDIRFGNEPVSPNQTWQWLGDNNNSQRLHKSLDISIQPRVSLLSPFDMNLGHRYYRNKYSKRHLPHEPFIVHFAGPPSKPFLSNTPKYRKQVSVSRC